MHEASLVWSLLKQVECLADEHHSTAVKRIEVEIGPLSGVEPLLVRSAFEMLALGSVASAAELVITEVDLKAQCQACGGEFVLDAFRFVCPQCASRSIRVTHGDEFRLLNVMLETAEPLEC